MKKPVQGHRLANAFKNDPVYLVGIVISAITLVIAVCLALTPAAVLRETLMPAVISVYSPDGALEPGTLDALDSLFANIWAVSLLSGLLLLGYTLIWKYFSSRLSTAPTETIVPSISKISTFQACFLLLIILIGLILRLHGITRGLTFDEIWTAVRFVEVDSIWKTVSSYQNFNNHIAYSVLAKISQSIFGRHEWALRLPALLIGLATLYYLWIFGRSFVTPPVALAAVACLAVSPTHVLWSQSARGYSGMILFTLMSTHLYLLLLRRPTIPLASVFVIASSIGIYFHLYAGFVPMVQALFLLYLAISQVFSHNSAIFLHRESFGALWLSWPAIIALSLILHAPVLSAVILNVLTTGYRCFQALFPIDVINDLSGNIATPFQVLLLLLFICGSIALRSSQPKHISYFPLLLLLPLLATWLLAPYHLYTRFFVYFLPYYVLFFVTGFFVLWNHMRNRSVRVATHYLRAFLVLLAVSMLFNWTINAWKNVSEGGFRPAVRAMEMAAGESVGLCAIGGGSAHFYQYYTQREILVPETEREFQKIVESHAEIWCAYHAGAGEPAWQRKVVSSLSKTARKERFGEVIVFRFKRP